MYRKDFEAMDDYTSEVPEFLGPEISFDKRIAKFKEILGLCRGRVLFLGGAGTSTGSGIPDFRSKNGLYNNMAPQYARYKPEYLLSHSCYTHKPQVFYEFYRGLFDLRKFEPCEAHRKLAKLEEDGVLMGIVTQNVDMLHEKAGSKNVMKIHGTVETNHCVRCNKKYDQDWFFGQSELIPRCECGGQVRPDVVLYEEKMPTDAWEKANRAVQEASLLIVAGTSLAVGTAASLVANYSGTYLVILNSQETPFDKYADVCFREDMNEVFAML